MGDAPTYDPNKQWGRGDLTPVPHPAGSYGGRDFGSAVSGGGFQYDAATLHDLVKHWTDLANEYQDDRTKANYIAQAKPPGAEYASDGNALAVRGSGAALLSSLEQREKYCRAMAAKLIAALGKYASAEEQHANDIKASSEGIV